MAGLAAGHDCRGADPPQRRRLANGHSRQAGHAVEVLLRPGISDLGAGSTIRVEITSQLRGAVVVGSVAAGDRTVEVSIQHNGRERVRRSFSAPRLTEVELLGRAIEGSSPDPVAVDALAMGLALLRGPSGGVR